MANMAQSPNGYAGHQMPPLPPIQQQQSYTSQNSQQAKRPGARPSSKSGFSFHSGKSRGSIDNPKIDLHESPREKAARRLSTKADPRMALSEAEPCENFNATDLVTYTNQCYSCSCCRSLDSPRQPSCDAAQRSRWPPNWYALLYQH